MDRQSPTLKTKHALLLCLAGAVALVGCKSESSTAVDAKQQASSEASIADLTPKDATLSPKRQEEVWNAEHATHLIEHRLGVRFKNLLSSRSLDGLSKLFVNDAKVELKDWRNLKATQLSSIRTGKSDEKAPTSPSNQSELAKWLVDLHSSLENPKFAFRVLAIEAEDDGWKAKMLLTGTGKSAGNIKQIKSQHDVTYRWQDVDQLEQSSSISAWSVRSVQTSEAPQKLMAEVTTPAGLGSIPIKDNWQLPTGRPPQMIRFQMAVEDYDRDGFLDIALSSAGNNFLLKFVNGQFKPVTTSVGIHSAARGEHVDISAGWIDYDNDGYPDLILGGRLYHNQQGRQFVDVTSQSGIEFHPHHMGCAVADYDADGFNDVYFIYAHDRTPNAQTGKAWIGDDQSGGSNQLWKNNGDGTFSDATEVAGVSGGKRQSFASTWLFADEDQFPDLYVANDFGTNSLFRNRGDGTFEDVSEVSGTSDFATSMGVASGDLDNDGVSEIYVANMYSKMGRRIVGQVRDADYPPGVFPRLQGACAGSRLYSLGQKISDPAQEFSLQAGVNQVGWAYAPVMTDFNNDGLLDMYATCGFISVDRSKPDG